MIRIRTVVLSLTAVAAGLVPLGLAAPAQAAASNGCTVTPGRPVFAGDFTVNGLPNVIYPITVTCSVGLIVDTEQTRAEQDTQAREGDTVDDITGVSLNHFDFTAAGGTRTVNVKRALVITGPATEGFDEEVYQSLRFTVSSGPVTSPWTAPELSLPRTIYY